MDNYLAGQVGGLALGPGDDASEVFSCWQKLYLLSRESRHWHLRDMFAADPQRAQRYAIELDALYCDYSKQLINSDVVDALLALAQAGDLAGWIKKLFTGEVVNFSEQRAALHTALRTPLDKLAATLPKQQLQQIEFERKRFYELVDAVRSGKWKGVTGKSINAVVNIGIGGSSLGPEMVIRALQGRTSEKQLPVHFLVNMDDFSREQLLQTVDPERTLFVVVSKSFATQETLLNAERVKNWLQQKLGRDDAPAHQFIAVTANVASATDFGIKPEHCLTMWDWVGGRYSLWSGVGLSIALVFGNSTFANLLSGGALMDNHFSSTPLQYNLPVMLALLGIWNRNFLNYPALAVIPYVDSLVHFVPWMQQLDMESNGKRADHRGQCIDYATAPVIWGGVGTGVQHAFFQALHQGTDPIPVDFIALAASGAKDDVLQVQQLANCLAQASALMQGKTQADVIDAAQVAAAKAGAMEAGLVDAGLADSGLAEASIAPADIGAQQRDPMLGWKEFPGNRPSNFLLLQELNPKTLGMLIALYEHKVFVQSVIWQINAFDQWGVELGKELADEVLEHLQTAGHTAAFQEQRLDRVDASTANLIRKYKVMRQ